MVNVALLASGSVVVFFTVKDFVVRVFLAFSLGVHEVARIASQTLFEICVLGTVGQVLLDTGVL
jgi:hypothetical protein